MGSQRRQRQTKRFDTTIPPSTTMLLLSTIRRGGGGGDYYGGSDDIMDPRGTMNDIDGGDATSIVDYDHLVDGAYGWCCNLGAPSALVAGAVVASIYENMSNPNSDYDPSKGDTKLIGFGKKLVRWLLITAFAFEALCIFVMTVTGTMLLSEDVDSMIHQGIVRSAKTPLQFLHDHFEFEYITGHITFLQGLLNWFIAIAVSHAIPAGDGQQLVSSSTTTMNQFLAIILFTTTVFMLSIYNKHIYFYDNYGVMLHRWFQLILQRFIIWPPRPLSFILFPAMVLSLVLGIKVFFTTQHDHAQLDDMTTKTKRNDKRITK